MDEGSSDCGAGEQLIGDIFDELAICSICFGLCASDTNTVVASSARSIALAHTRWCRLPSVLPCLVWTGGSRGAGRDAGGRQAEVGRGYAWRPRRAGSGVRRGMGQRTR